MKICQQCKTEMKLSEESGIKMEIRINKPIIPYLSHKGDQYIPDIETYICPKCGLIQQYIKEECMDILKYL